MQQFMIVDKDVMDRLERIEKNQTKIIRQNTTIQVGGLIFGTLILGGVLYLVADNRRSKKRGD